MDTLDARAKLLPFDHDTVIIPAGAVSLAQAKACLAVYAEVVVETAELRYWKDGGAPTAVEGILAGPGAIIELVGQEVARFRAIRTGGFDGKVQATFYKQKPGSRNW